MKESTIERAVVEHCKTLGLLTYKFSSPAHRGVPDRIILGSCGRVIFLELKAPGKIPTALQYREIHRLRAQGFAAQWADSAEDAIRSINLALV